MYSSSTSTASSSAKITTTSAPSTSSSTVSTFHARFFGVLALLASYRFVVESLSVVKNDEISLSVGQYFNGHILDS